jgi:hypothetical protein
VTMAKATSTSNIPIRTARHFGGRIIGFVMFMVALALVGIVIGAVIELTVSYLGTLVALVAISPLSLLLCLR